MPPKYHGVYNFIIIWSQTLGKGLMIWFDWTISKSNEWVTCILRSSNVHSKSFSQSVSETFPHGWFHYQLSPKQGVSLFFFHGFFHNTETSMDFAARFPLRLCDRRSWDHQLTFTPPRLAMLLSLSLGFSPSVEWLAKVWESHEKSMGRLYPLISYDKFWPSHLCMNIINNKKWLARDTDADTQIFNHTHYTSQAQRRRFHTFWDFWVTTSMGALVNSYPVVISHNGKSPFLIGKSTIDIYRQSIAIFHSYVTNYQRRPSQFKHRLELLAMALQLALAGLARRRPSVEPVAAVAFVVAALRPVDGWEHRTPRALPCSASHVGEKTQTIC